MSLPAPFEQAAPASPGSVLHVITRLDRGGSAENTILSCIGLAHRGWAVTLAFGPTKDPTPMLGTLERLGTIPLVRVPDLVRAVRPISDLRASRTLRALVARGSYDVVHTHTSKAGLLGRRAARGLRCKVVHTPHGHVFHGYFNPALTRVFVAAERRAARWCDRIVVLTDRGREDHLDAGVGRLEQFVTIPSGVPLASFLTGFPNRERSRSAWAIDEGASVAGCVARLVKVKGQEILLEAAARLAGRHPSLRILLAGDGEERGALEERARRDDLRGRVIFTGHLDDPRPALAAMDLFVLPSHNEGQGRAAVEAMAAGLPVVASSVGGLPEVLDRGAAGMLVAPEDPDALASALDHLLTHPEEAHLLAEAGRRRASRYGIETMIDGLDALYRSLLGAGGSPEGLR